MAVAQHLGKVNPSAPHVHMCTLATTSRCPHSTLLELGPRRVLCSAVAGRTTAAVQAYRNILVCALPVDHAAIPGWHPSWTSQQYQAAVTIPLSPTTGGTGKALLWHLVGPAKPHLCAAEHKHVQHPIIALICMALRPWGHQAAP